MSRANGFGNVVDRGFNIQSRRFIHNFAFPISIKEPGSIKSSIWRLQSRITEASVGGIFATYESTQSSGTKTEKYFRDLAQQLGTTTREARRFVRLNFAKDPPVQEIKRP